MIRWWSVGLIAIEAICLMSCISAKTTSMVDPGGVSTKKSRILLIANFADFENLKMYEQVMRGALASKALNGYPQSVLLPPIREYTAAEKSAVVDKYKIDAALILSPIGYSAHTVEVPLVSTTSASANGSLVTVTTGGSREQLSSLSFEGKLIDLTSGKAVWVAQVVVDVSNSMDAYGKTEVANLVCREIVLKLVADGIVGNTPSAPVTGGG